MQEKERYDEEEVVLLSGKWSDIAEKMFEAESTPFYMEMKAKGEHIAYLKHLDYECSMENRRLREQMMPKTTDDWYTNWRNLEMMQSRIDEIIIHEYIEPKVLSK